MEIISQSEEIKNFVMRRELTLKVIIFQFFSIILYALNSTRNTVS